ncbi:MAG: hypothetical protein Q8930_13930, partial [Bacillota bacterium]|nr:hypothetical protein [Bacillota bacterium]
MHKSKIRGGDYRFRYRIIISALTTVTVALAIFLMYNYDSLKNLQANAQLKQESIDSKDKEVNTKLLAVSTNIQELNDKYYEEKLLQLFSKDKLASMAKDAWTYSLKVNDADFQSDNITTKERNITIVLTQILDPNKPFPKEILSLGSVTGSDSSDNFYDHMIIKTTVPYEKNFKAEGNTTTATYTFKNIPAGTIIALNLSEPLKERLKLDYDQLEV